MRRRRPRGLPALRTPDSSRRAPRHRVRHGQAGRGRAQGAAGQGRPGHTGLDSAPGRRPSAGLLRHARDPARRRQRGRSPPRARRHHGPKIPTGAMPRPPEAGSLTLPTVPGGPRRSARQAAPMSDLPGRPQLPRRGQARYPPRRRHRRRYPASRRRPDPSCGTRARRPHIPPGPAPTPAVRYGRGRRPRARTHRAAALPAVRPARDLAPRCQRALVGASQRCSPCAGRR